MQDDLIIRLETRLTYLEAANGELSDVVYRQQRELDQLRARVESLVEQLDQWRSQPREWSVADEKPPHY